MRQIPPLDLTWLVLESRDTPMHVGALFEFTLPEDAPEGYLAQQFEMMREPRPIPAPWSLKLADPPVMGPRMPLMVEDRAIDLDYHVRHSALPAPGGQRELGILVSRLHSHQLDFHRPLWEAHVIEGVSPERFALYVKMHHSVIDGVSGVRLILKALTTDPGERGMRPFWTIGPSKRPKREAGSSGGPTGLAAGLARGGVRALRGMAGATLDLARAAVDDRALHTPYVAPRSVLQSRITGQRRFATQHYELERLRALARAADCTLNDIVLYLSGSALRRYLAEHSLLPTGALTAGIPVNLREAEDETVGTVVAMIVAELGTNIADPIERLEAIKASAGEAKEHLRALPPEARAPYALLLGAPYIAGLVSGLGNLAPVPFSVTVSNVPGPTERLYFNGARLDAVFPLSLLLHGMALNITCLSYAGTLNFGFTGARERLPHLQRLAIYMGEALEELEDILGTSPEPAGTPAGAAVS